jgi:hypothetical protein
MLAARCLLGTGAVLLLVAPAGAARDNQIPAAALGALQKAERFELWSLNPERPRVKPKDAFHGWRVLGKTQVKDASTRRKLIAALQKGVAENDGRVANCFNPRHGIRVIFKKKTVDFVICFECFQVQVFGTDKRAGGFLTTGSPQAAFDQVLRETGVPLPKKGRK